MKKVVDTNQRFDMMAEEVRDDRRRTYSKVG